MAFKHPVYNPSLQFNSAYSSRLLDIYKAQEESEIRMQCAGTKSRTFAPSGMRCARKQWFRLRGTETDPVERPDSALNFRADVGSVRHIVIQSRLRHALGADWIEIPDFLRDHPIQYKYHILQSDIESLIEIDSPPIKFAVDGIIRIDGKLFLLEIKTCDYTALEAMQSHKKHHEDQGIHLRIRRKARRLPDAGSGAFHGPAGRARGRLGGAGLHGMPGNIPFHPDQSGLPVHGYGQGRADGGGPPA